MSRESVEIAVVGAGVVGLATAHALAVAGREVHVLDPDPPGAGASYGNAGTLAPYACAPTGNPALLRDALRLLFGRDSPFALRWSELPTLTPWLARFAMQSFNGPARANALALASLLSEAVPAWRELGQAIGASDLLCDGGCVYAYARPEDANPWADAIRAELGASQRTLSPDELAALEPNLPRMAGGAALFPDAVRIADPAKLTRRLAEAATAQGATFRRVRVERLAPQREGRVHIDGPGLSLSARKVVVSAGAFSKGLALQVGDRIPLGVERGYHVEFATPEPLLRRPVCPVGYGFYLTPMDGRLRAAGTVELGGVTAPPTPARFDFIESRVRKLFPSLGPATGKWLGFRPSLPDSRPVIGYSRASRSVVHAFGHGHLGMTLAAVSARHVAALIAETADANALAPFSLARFVRP